MEAICGLAAAVVVASYVFVLVVAVIVKGAGLITPVVLLTVVTV